MYAKGLKREVEDKRAGRLHCTKQKANNMYISILRCTTLLGKSKTKELSDTQFKAYCTCQNVCHFLYKCAILREKRKTLAKSLRSNSLLCLLPLTNSSIWKPFNSILKIAWKDQTIGRSLSLSRTVTLWRWCSKGVKMGQQAIVGLMQGHVKRTLLKSHTQKNIDLKEFSFNLKEVREGRN